MINIQNINIINSKLLISNDMIDIKKKINNYFYYKYYCKNNVIIEFNVYQIMFFIGFIKFLVEQDSNFDIGVDIYKNKFYILLNFDITFSTEICDIEVKYQEINNFTGKIIDYGGYGKIYYYDKKNIIKIGYFNNGINEIINYFKLNEKIKHFEISFERFVTMIEKYDSLL